MDIKFASLLMAVPLMSAVLLIIFPRQESNDNSKQVALFGSAVTFALSLFAAYSFNFSSQDMQFVEHYQILPKWGINLYLGIDGLSLPFILLSSLLFMLCIYYSFEGIKIMVKEYMVLFLLLEVIIMGFFTSQNMVFFYLFFEIVLVPMLLIIGIWGGKRRIYASLKFFLFTFTGSVFMLLGMIYMIVTVGSADINTLQAYNFTESEQFYLWLALFVAFAVKIPMFPVHTWLPNAHVEAPTAGSVILAGILLKMGGYGLLRFNLPMFPWASYYFAPLVFVLSLAAIIYTSLVAYAQSDAKKLIAYSSVAHMGFVTLGLFSGHPLAINGAIFQMISHGIISPALFLSVGVVYDRFHTRDISAFGGLKQVMPRYNLLFLIAAMGSVGLPMTAGFVGEVLVIVGTSKTAIWLSLLAASGMVLGAIYTLNFFRRVMLGNLNPKLDLPISDLDVRELLILSTLSILIVLLGVCPDLVFEYINHFMHTDGIDKFIKLSR